MQFSYTAFSALLLATAGTAQLTHVIPNGMATAAGASASPFPWGTTAPNYTGVRVLACYDSSNFTAASITSPIVITGLRWRADDTTWGWPGGTYAQATVSLSTAVVDVTQVTPTWANNHGPDLTECYSGPVTVQAGTGGGFGVPGPHHIDVQLTAPFTYDPSQGDLCIDTDFPGGGNFSGGGVISMDVDTTAGLGSRVYASTQYPFANGTTQNHGIVVEVSYLPVPGNVATTTTYGSGCYDDFSSIYEVFPANTFDLSNTGMTFIPSNGGYAVIAGAGAWFTPVSAPLTLGDDEVSVAQPLGFTLAYPGGTTPSVWVSSNGFVWGQQAPSHGCCAGHPHSLLGDLPRWSLLWNDLNPNASGAVHFDVDPANSAAYVTFDNVPEFGTQNGNTFQVAFFSNGNVEYRFQVCAIANHTCLTGWSPGGGARNPGQIDFSGTLPVATAPDRPPLTLLGMGRPIIGSGVLVTARDVPTTSTLGVFVGGVTQINPGTNLGPLGMLDCWQYLSLDATRIFLPTAGSGAFTFNVPNDPGFNGVSIYLQAAALTPGVNVLGVLSSNGLDLKVGLQ